MNYLFYSAYCCPLVTSVLVEIIWNHSISACWIFPHTNYAYTPIILHVPCNLFTNYYLLPVPRETTYTQPSVLFVNVWSQQSSGDDITVGWFSKLLQHSWPRHCTSVNFLPPQPHVHMSAHIHVFTGRDFRAPPCVAGENINTMQQKFTNDPLHFLSLTHTLTRQWGS